MKVIVQLTKTQVAEAIRQYVDKMPAASGTVAECMKVHIWTNYRANHELARVEFDDEP